VLVVGAGMACWVVGKPARGEAPGVDHTRRGDPAPPVAHRAAGRHLRPAVTGQPAAAPAETAQSGEDAGPGEGTPASPLPLTESMKSSALARGRG